MMLLMIILKFLCWIVYEQFHFHRHTYEWFVSLINFSPSYCLCISNLHWNLINMHHSFSSLKIFFFFVLFLIHVRICISFMCYVEFHMKYKKKNESGIERCRTMMHVKFHAKLCSLLKYGAIMLFSYNMSYLHRTNVLHKNLFFFYFCMMFIKHIHP